MANDVRADRTRATATGRAGAVRVGVGGWTYPPWRGGTFFPAGLKQAQELSWASRQLTTIEINGTYYRTQTPASFERWRDEAPAGFVFAVKGNRYVTGTRDLAKAAASVQRFLESGVVRLGDKLGPINWQFPPTRRFDEAEFNGFLDLLPARFDGQRLRHVVELRHASFAVPAVVAALRERNIGVVVADAARFPRIHDPTADFLYLRLQGCEEHEPDGYPGDGLDSWAARCRLWADGDQPSDLPLLGPPPKPGPRDVFAFFISGHKPKAPAAARALIARLSDAAAAAGRNTRSPRSARR